MDLSKVLEQLRRELQHINVAIASLERLQEKDVRRGRPPKILSELRDPKPEPRPESGRRRQVRTSGPDK